MKASNVPVQAAFEDLLKKIGNKLYDIRHSRREKITNVANGVGVSHPVISLIENGRYKSLTFNLLHKICEYYEVELLSIIK